MTWSKVRVSWVPTGGIVSKGYGNACACSADANLRADAAAAGAKWTAGSSECAIFFVVCSVFADRGAVMELDWLWGVRVLLFVLASVCSSRFAGCCAAVDRAAKTEDTFDAVVERM